MRIRHLAVFAILAATSHAVSANDALRFGVVPQGSPADVLRAWTPVADALTDALGRPVVAETERDIPTFEACVQAGVYDIVYMNPYHYVIFDELTGYRAVAHRANALLNGLIVVREDSGLHALTDLEGLEIAFPSPAAFAASILQRAELRAAGISFTPIYTRSHSSAYLAVARGVLPAGAGVDRTLAAFSQNNEAFEDFRFIHVTNGYTPHPIAVSPRLGPETTERVAAILTALDEMRPDALEPLSISGFQRPSAKAYDDVRALPLSIEETGINLTSEPPCPSG